MNRLLLIIVAVLWLPAFTESIQACDCSLVGKLDAAKTCDDLARLAKPILDEVNNLGEGFSLGGVMIGVTLATATERDIEFPSECRRQRKQMAGCSVKVITNTRNCCVLCVVRTPLTTFRGQFAFSALRQVCFSIEFEF